MTYLLYNPLANNSKGDRDARQWATDNNVECEFTSLLEIGNMKEFFDGLGEDDDVILTGGDGTLNRFANDVYGYEFKTQCITLNVEAAMIFTATTKRTLRTEGSTSDRSLRTCLWSQ